MPAPMFMRGAAPWRNTLAYLDAGTIVFRPMVRIFTLNYTLDKPDSDGLRRFIFWHLAQIQYKNPNVQCVQFKNTTPTPFVSFYLSRSQLDTADNEAQINNDYEIVHMDCYKKTSNDIHESVRRVMGKSDLQQRIDSELTARLENPANFGKDCAHYCMCLVYGQMSCSGKKLLPEFLRGKYTRYKVDELEEIRKNTTDEIALKDYWKRPF
jgi:small subunit ribosomal protein S25